MRGKLIRFQLKMSGVLWVEAELFGFLSDAPVGGAADGLAEIELLLGLDRFEGFVVNLNGDGFGEAELSTVRGTGLRGERTGLEFLLKLSVFIGFGDCARLPCSAIEGNAHDDF